MGSGEIGLKQALVPAGMIPLAAVKYEKLSQPLVRDQMELQASVYGKKNRLCHFVFKEVLLETKDGV